MGKSKEREKLKPVEVKSKYYQQRLKKGGRISVRDKQLKRVV